MSDDSALIVYDDGPIRHIRLNRPEKLNALDLQQHERVIKALNAAEVSRTVRVIAFSGEGRSFCSGDDLKPTDRVWPERYQKGNLPPEEMVPKFPSPESINIIVIGGGSKTLYQTGANKYHYSESIDKWR